MAIADNENTENENWIDDNRERAFVLARRHTRFVRVMRLALPALTLFICGGIIYFSGLLTSTPPTFEITSIGIKDGTLTMENARLTGVNEDNRAYVVNADTASQQLSQPDVFDLDNIDAQISGGDAAWASVEADRGQYDREQETLRLEQDVHVLSGDGYDVQLESAFVDLKAGTVVSDDPVEVQMMNGTVNAQGLEISNNGQTIRFFNGVSLNFTPGGTDKNSETSDIGDE
ncbi:MAG: LPS export ABC transporter periplasmic protein LptC [Rhizobiales bacterium]|nr:LPS export ABC transporter periplasmic protein LptC [Hyphomicrobiales bacterium]